MTGLQRSDIMFYNCLKEFAIQMCVKLDFNRSMIRLPQSMFSKESINMKQLYDFSLSLSWYQTKGCKSQSLFSGRPRLQSRQTCPRLWSEICNFPS